MKRSIVKTQRGSSTQAIKRQDLMKLPVWVLQNR